MLILDFRNFLYTIIIIMSVSRNFGRTLSGATDLSVDNIRLPDNVNTIKINGNSGLPNQFLGKNATTGKLEWDFVETSSIPDNSIVNAKLKDKTIENDKIKNGTIIGSLMASDISFSTTGTINANKLTADVVELPKTGTAQTIIDSDGINMNGTQNITIDNGDFDTSNGNVIVRNGGVLDMFSDLNTTKTIILDGSDGEITCEDINVNNHTGTITFNEIRTDKLELPKTGAVDIVLNSGGLAMSGSSQNVLIVGDFITSGGDYKVYNGGKVNLFSDGGATSQIELNGTNGNITSTGGNTSLYNATISNSLIADGNGIYTTDIRGSSNANTPYNYTLTGSSGDISTNGNITLNTGNDLLINDGGKLDLFSDGGTTRTIDIDGSTGDLKIYNPLNGNERLELDGTSGNILVRSGGRIDMYAGNDSDINIELNGVNGIIDCVDINVLSHTGTINFANIRTDSLTLPENGTAECEILSNGNIITNGTITSGAIGGTSLTSGTTISATGLISGGSITTAGNITATGTGAGYIGVGTDGDSYKILLNKSGIIECDDLQCSEVDATTLDGDTIIFNTKLQQTSASNFSVDSSGNTTIGGTTTFTGDMTSTNGNITLTNGDITLTNGAFRGEVIGDITEEHIHAQSLEIRDNGSGGGDTGIDIKDGYNITFEDGSGSSIIMNDCVMKTNTTSTSTMNLDFDAGTLKIKDGTGTTDVMNVSDEFITIVNPTTLQDGLKLSDTFIRLNDSSNNTENPRVIIESVDGISMISGTSNYNLTINPLGDVSFLTTSGDLRGYDGSSSTYTNNSTQMEHFRLDETNYKYHLYEIGVNIPNQTFLERSISTTSTAWFDLNDRLSVKLISNAETNTNFVVEFNFYAVITNGARLFFKLFDSSIPYLDNYYQPSYLNNTMSQVLLDTNGANDFAGVHNVKFLVRNFPANTSKTIRVAGWVITTSGHKVIFKTGNFVLGSTSTNPSSSLTKYPPMFLQAKKLLGTTNVNTNSPTGWTAPSEDDY